jgi:hypothetical protein
MRNAWSDRIMATDRLFEIPEGESVTVKLINPVNFGPSHLKRFMTPQVPGLETFARNPAFSFVIEHSSGRKLVFDLGIRKDWQNYAPKIADYIPTTRYDIEVTQNVAEILEEHGIQPEEIEAVIWRCAPYSKGYPSRADMDTVTGTGTTSATPRPFPQPQT